MIRSLVNVVVNNTPKTGLGLYVTPAVTASVPFVLALIYPQKNFELIDISLPLQ